MDDGLRRDARASRAELIAEIVSSGREVARITHTHNAMAWIHLDITIPQMKVLVHLYLGGEANMARLAGALDVKLPTITGLVDRLVERGLVRREEDPQDRRLVVAHLTDEARAVMDRLWQAGWLQLGQRLECASTEELQAIHQGIQALIQVIRRACTDRASAGYREGTC